MKLVLASGSPRRAELLTQAGFSFVKRVSDAKETLPDGLSPAAAVEFLAKTKGCAVARADQEVLLAADTVVAYNGEILGKPTDEADAMRMLSMLSGHTHSVYTGVYITDGVQTALFHEKTDVTFFSLSAAQIAQYVQTGEPMDKAGAYGIQGRGALLVQGIHGDFYNVVGLPLAKTAKYLKEGFSL